MNYYNPYFYGLSSNSLNSAASLGSKINFSSILTNTQKIVGIINQTIPVIKQAGPVVKNAKTMFKVMNEFKKVESPKKIQNNVNNVDNVNNINKVNEQITSENVNTENNITKQDNNGPTFFI